MEQYDVLVVGGGNAGISVAARLLRDGASEVALVESQPVHRYRPLYNYVGAGEARMSRLEKPAREVVPKGCEWIRDEVVTVDPSRSEALTRAGRTLRYRTLVVCPGLTEDWEAVPGLREAYADGWAVSTFLTDTVPTTWSGLRDLRGGTVVFTLPPEPAPCGATALKPLFMACDHWRRQGVLPDIDVRLVVPGSTVLGIRDADARLEQILAAYGVDVLRDARLASVDAVGRSVSLTHGTGTTRLDDVRLAHLVPHYRAPRWIADSGLADDGQAHLVDVDPETLQHRRHAHVWSSGDAAALATRPSGGALREQTEVLAHNIRAVATGGELRRYDGYTVMPITTSRRRLMLVEVDRDGDPAPSVPLLDLTKPRRLTWWFDRYVLPQLYWRRILRGKT